MGVLHYFGAAIGLGMIVIGEALGIGKFAAAAAEGIARQPGAADKITGAVNLPLDRLEREAATLDPARPTALICAGGYRSSVAASLLEQRGFGNLYNVVGGTAAWIAAGYPSET